MYNLNLSKEQFSDFLNLFYKVFYPVEKFVNKEQFLKIILKNKFKRHFFSFCLQLICHLGRYFECFLVH